MDINNLWSGYDLNSKKQNSRCLAVNTILEGKYLVGPVLGQGGFGITYVGYDLNMEAKIAIKEYFPVELVSRDTTTMHGDRVLSLSGEKSVTYKQGLKKYVAEAQNVSQFSEIPGVVSVKDFFYANETAYIVMEYIDGISLKDYLKEKGGRLTEEETLKIMKPVLEALVQVHKSGIIHRDISPDNIMLTFEGSGHSKIQSVKLIDFGAARMTAKNDQKSLTIILKHGYAPEEQYRTHGEQGPWTDVYALCAVLYRMLTGETPVPAMDRMFKDELKTLEQCGAKVSANTSAAILKGLAVKKDDRIQNVQKLIGALYEGAKVKNTAGAGKNNSKKIGLFAGVGVAAMAMCAAGIMALSGGKEVSLKKESEVERIPENTMVAAENTSAEKTEETKTSADAEDTIMSETIAMDQDEDDLGEPIVFYRPQDAIAEFNDSLILCRPDGTVDVKGSNTDGQHDAKEWTGVVSVKTGYHHVLGLRTDGTVVVTDHLGREEGAYAVDHWTNIVDIAAGPIMSLGLTANGDVLAAGDGNSPNIDLNHLSQWSDIKQIDCCYGRYDCIVGLKNDGTILFEGDFDKAIQGWENIENICLNPQGILVGMEKDGTVHAVALNNEKDVLQWAEMYNQMPKMKQLCGPGEGIRIDGTYFNADEWAKPVEWTDMEAFIGWNGAEWGIKTDSTIVNTIEHGGNASLEEFVNLSWVKINRGDNGSYSSIIGKTKDGRILGYDTDDLWTELLEELNGTSDITEISSLMAVLENGELHSPYEHREEGLPKTGVRDVITTTEGYIFLMQDGTVAAYGNSEEHPHQCKDLVKNWTNIVQICGDDEWACGLRSDGTVLRTDEEYENGRIVENDVASIYGAPHSCFGVRSDGTVVMVDSGANAESFGLNRAEQWTDMAQLAVSDTHVVGLKKDGTVVAVGNNSCGECNVEEWENVISIDAADNCTIGLTKDGKLLMTGEFY